MSKSYNTQSQILSIAVSRAVVRGVSLDLAAFVLPVHKSPVTNAWRSSTLLAEVMAQKKKSSTSASCVDYGGGWEWMCTEKEDGESRMRSNNVEEKSLGESVTEDGEKCTAGGRERERFGNVTVTRKRK
ncbi:RING-type domain-containing protein [Psidium guajava]|nr:RING-type domain-containing protein [Psidium guajava]